MKKLEAALSIIMESVEKLERDRPSSAESPSPPPSLDPAEIRTIIVEIVQLMDLDISAAKERVTQLEKLIEPSPRLEEIVTALEEYDTETAGKCVIQMAEDMNIDLPFDDLS